MPRHLCPVVVGRDDELDVLRQALGGLASGEGRCVLLAGEPGIGKSRLAREAMTWATAGGIPVALGRASPAPGPAFRPVADALLRLVGECGPTGAALAADPGLAPWLPALAPLLPVLAEPGRAGADLPPGVRAEAVLQVLRRVAGGGAVIVLEDLHWADPDTVALVEYLADHLHRRPLLLVGTLRDQPPSEALAMAHRHRGGGPVTYLALERLTAGRTAAMVRACHPGVADGDLRRVQETAEGVPLLIEELLATPGVPASFAAAVTERLARLGRPERSVLQAAAVLGRHFDWQLLGPASAQPDGVVTRALEEGVASLLLSAQGGDVRFRHALTREAVLDTLLPPEQRQVAAAALAALERSRPELDDADRTTAVDLAVRAGDRHRAGRWLLASGRQALSWGALASAADSMRRAATLLAGAADQPEAELGLVEALALAGRVEEAAAAGGRLVARLEGDGTTVPLRIGAHLQLARAAITASRWPLARQQLASARRLAGEAPPPDVAGQLTVLEADLALAGDDYERARALAVEVTRSPAATPEVRCHAHEIVGRTLRSQDLARGRRAFEEALATAEANGLPLWRLRALHELGTIDLFDHAGVARLEQARLAAEQTGAVSTAAVLDLQLAAGYTCRWELDVCDAHAQAAAETGARLGLEQVRAKALAMLAGSASMRADLDGTEHYAQLVIAAAPEDPMLRAFCLGSRGVALLLAGDLAACVGPWSRAMAILGRLPHAEPAALRALWPLVLAATGDRRALPAVDEARRLGVAAFGLNRGLVAYAEAAVVGSGDPRRARQLVEGTDGGFANCGAWLDLARTLAAPMAAAGGWADVEAWLVGAADRFTHRGLPAMNRRCRELAAAAGPNPWSAVGVTTREADVVRLVAEGLPNKDIAARLHLSPRTVEKHVESLLRKTGARTRTELVARLTPGAGAT